MPKKITTPAAAVASAEADEDLLQKLAAKIAVIQERSGRFKGGDMASKEKIVGKILPLWKSRPQEDRMFCVEKDFSSKPNK